MQRLHWQCGRISKSALEDARRRTRCSSRLRQLRSCALLVCVLASLSGCSLNQQGTGGNVADVDPLMPLDPPGADTQIPGNLVSDASADSNDAQTAGAQSGLSAPLDAGRSTLTGGPVDARVRGLDAHAGSEPPLSDAGATEDASLDPPAPCEARGGYALRIDYDVTWDPTKLADMSAAFSGGAGTVSLFMQLALVADPGASLGQASLLPCGITVPDYGADAVGFQSEHYGSHVADSAWSSAGMPRWNVVWQPGCDGNGCALKLATLVAPLGAHVMGVDAMGKPGLAFDDPDVDGVNGLTFLSRGPPELSASGQAYTFLPLGGVVRARQLGMAVGATGTLEGTFDGCNSFSGEVKDASLAQVGVACRGVIMGTNTEVACDDNTAKFFQSTLPVWKVAAARFRGVRVPGNDCAIVRAALP